MAGVEVRAVARHIRMSPQKVRLVLDTIRGKPVSEALNILRFLPHKATEPVAKVIRSASANAENKFALDPDELIVTRIYADESRTLKRYRPRARGRANQILKRSSHVTVVVSTSKSGRASCSPIRTTPSSCMRSCASVSSSFVGWPRPASLESTSSGPPTR